MPSAHPRALVLGQERCGAWLRGEGRRRPRCLSCMYKQPQWCRARPITAGCRLCTQLSSYFHFHFHFQFYFYFHPCSRLHFCVPWSFPLCLQSRSRVSARQQRTSKSGGQKPHPCWRRCGSSGSGDCASDMPARRRQAQRAQKPRVYLPPPGMAALRYAALSHALTVSNH